MMLCIITALSISASAQTVNFAYTGKVEPGKTIIPKAGDRIKFNVHVRGSDGKTDKAGTRYMLVSFARKNGTKTETIGSLLNLPQNIQDNYKAGKLTVLNEGTIKSVNNPVEIRVGDQLKVIFYKDHGKMVDIENTRNGKVLGKMRIQW
ncbi:hypothetical protein [Sphingobacterium bovistauri]|uniref:Uncharacterized protein n=1 Tax=Sphingobacterium bovistauri TaxID=2781959 RepID=A0ABS7ZA11_9SPHI|nr:hypothetical protein [Sphingobacterium bovistauri]MCA5005725.1 hypothetical protein [Sphingobacterium bovistauri]